MENNIQPEVSTTNDIESAPIDAPKSISATSELEPDPQNADRDNSLETSPTLDDFSAQLEQQSNPKKIVIKEPEVEKPVVEIVIPQPESLEIIESELALNKENNNVTPALPSETIDEDAIAITEPTVMPNSAISETKPKFLWWKKLLVKIRQQLESLARQLPDEVQSN